MEALEVGGHFLGRSQTLYLGTEKKGNPLWNSLSGTTLETWAAQFMAPLGVFGPNPPKVTQGHQIIPPKNPKVVTPGFKVGHSHIY